jgi:hypothetical protein
MNIPHFTRSFRLSLLVMAWAVGSRGLAADWQSLTGNSPFGGAAGATTATAPSELEFRGVVQEEGVYLINLFNPTTKTSQWIPVKGSAPGLEVKSYDASTDKVQVTLAGRALTLPLKQARVTLTQAAGPAAPVANADNAGDGANPKGDRPVDMGRGRPGNGFDPATMMRNLPPETQAMIQEFRRRRAERAGQPQPAPNANQP